VLFRERNNHGPASRLRIGCHCRRLPCRGRPWGGWLCRSCRCGTCGARRRQLSDRRRHRRLRSEHAARACHLDAVQSRMLRQVISPGAVFEQRRVARCRMHPI
jgi:hypothetical protein